MKYHRSQNLVSKENSYLAVRMEDEQIFVLVELALSHVLVQSNSVEHCLFAQQRWPVHQTHFAEHQPVVQSQVLLVLFNLQELLAATLASAGDAQLEQFQCVGVLKVNRSLAILDETLDASEAD